ncbi:sulfatase-like hydrolase/transferase [Microbacterium hominis]|uniref:sulfatase family protein n=1 Tax=Microbacterium TaxID=33882 RepID=UPI00168B51D6|nr:MULTISPECIES: sulfatase-like hydrolase/transferase [Microbacterium]QOC26994.1 sulfatase-like hydrolase/transferase [Microbacterium hominis]QOC28156.1 sulfatase-like hydrolase/transferase [Microbacterium hominis]QYF96671.1 sulfatase-like hydrolase/transferase [Microbacterium sp. PAMC21962]
MPQSDTPPNVVFIITDQQRWDTIAALGHSHAITPHLDRLVREGTAFTNMYVTSPSCAPSRASLFTGLYPHTTGVYRNDDVWRHSWVERVAAQGYRCVNVGKMHTFPYDAAVGFHERHVMENKDRGNPELPFLFDNWDKALWSHGYVKPDRRTLRDVPDYQDRLGAFVWELPEELHVDNFVGNMARHWVDVFPGLTDLPFFLQIGFPGPHPPYDAVPAYLDLFEGREVPEPVNSAADRDGQPSVLKALRAEHVRNDHDSVVHDEDPERHRSLRQRRHYLANISMIDAQIGRLLDALEARGVLDNTIVIFTSDHGDTLGDHGHSQKWTMYEGSVRVPAIVWGPKFVRQGSRVDGLASLFDLGPTILELAGADIPPWMEATSLRGALTGDGWEGRAHVFAEHARDMILTETALMTMVRDTEWKLVEFIDSDEGQLFDLRTDPHEEHSLWDDPAAAGTKARLKEVISRWRAESALRTAGWASSSV